jgi:hypothetical protein
MREREGECGLLDRKIDRKKERKKEMVYMQFYLLELN